MATTPFRVAFWSLVIGIILIVPLTIPTSNGTLVTFRERTVPRTPGTSSEGGKLVDLTKESAVPVIFDSQANVPKSGMSHRDDAIPTIAIPTISKSPPESSPPTQAGSPAVNSPLVVVPVPEPTPSRAVPVRVAAASPLTSLGLTEPLVPSPDHGTEDHSTNPSSARPFPDTARVQSAHVPATAEEPRTISVPVPHHPDSVGSISSEARGRESTLPPATTEHSLQQAVADLQRAMQQTQQGVEDLKQNSWSDDLRGLQSELAGIREQLASSVATKNVTEAVERPHLPTDHRIETNLGESPFSTATLAPNASQETIIIREGRVSGTKSFEFREALISDVLKTLGEYSGWTVVVHPEVTGTYTGEFLNADPDQAFVVAVKIFDCAITARGTYALVGKRPERTTR